MGPNDLYHILTPLISISMSEARYLSFSPGLHRVYADICFNITSNVGQIFDIFSFSISHFYLLPLLKQLSFFIINNVTIFS